MGAALDAGSHPALAPAVPAVVSVTPRQARAVTGRLDSGPAGARAPGLPTRPAGEAQDRARLGNRLQGGHPVRPPLRPAGPVCNQPGRACRRSAGPAGNRRAASGTAELGCFRAAAFGPPSVTAAIAESMMAARVRARILSLRFAGEPPTAILDRIRIPRPRREDPNPSHGPGTTATRIRTGLDPSHSRLGSRSSGRKWLLLPPPDQGRSLSALARQSWQWEEARRFTSFSKDALGIPHFVKTID